MRSGRSTPSPTSGSCSSSAASSTRRGFTSPSTRWHRSSSTWRNVRFVVAGTGTAEAELRRQAWRLGLHRKGVFLGWVGDDMLHSLYRIADMSIVPSIYEPFGIVALEAMASGCLCVVADTGGLREVVPDDGTVGLRFPSRDAAALQEIVERVLTDDAERAQLVAEAREHVLRFDWAEVARQTLGLYRRELRAAAARAVTVSGS